MLKKIKVANKQAIAGIFILSFTMTLLNIESARAAVPYKNAGVSLNGSMQTGNCESSQASASNDGKHVVFTSCASNLVSNDTNGKSDVFLRDTRNGTTQRISVSNSGVQGNDQSTDPHISNDGRYILFNSHATNIVQVNDNNNGEDVFLYDTQTSLVELISINSSGNRTGAGISMGADITADGRYVVFTSYARDLLATSDTADGVSDIYIRDRLLGVTNRLNNTYLGVAANGYSSMAQISCDGAYVIFNSNASNITINDTNGSFDVFLVDRTNGGTIQNITQSGNAGGMMGSPGSLSCNGRVIAFQTLSNNLANNDNNAAEDVYTYDRVSGIFERESVASNGAEANYGGNSAYLNSDGSYMTFVSFSSNLSSGDTNQKNDIFFRDRGGNTTEIVSKRTLSIQTVSESNEPAISADGTYIVFTSVDTGLVPNDTNGVRDVFISETGVDVATPSVVGSPDRLPNMFSWYKADVTINWSSTDPAPSSGTPTQPPATLANLEGTNTYQSGQSCDPSGNCATGSLVLSIDKTLPLISHSLSALPNARGWHKENVTVNYSCSDAVSGVNTCSPSTELSEGVNQTVTGQAVDNADNTASVTTDPINIDKMAPTILYSMSNLPNSKGWYNSDVTASFACTDNLSGMYACSPDVTFGEGANLSSVGQAVDNADNTANVTAGPVYVDKTAPSINYALSALANAQGWHNSDVTVDFSCSDFLSLVYTCSNDVILGEGANQTATGNAVDNADNGSSVTTSSISIDKTAGTTTNVAMSNTVLTPVNRTATMSADAADSLSGVLDGEYYIDTDPGQGNGTQMTYSAITGQVSKTVTFSGLTSGAHTMYIRSQDKAGNWTTVASISFYYF